VLPHVIRLAQLAGLDGAARLPNAVSREVAQALANRCREQFGADFGLAVTECSHGDDNEAHPTPPIVYIALADRETVDVRELNVAGDPAILKSRIAKSALNLVRLKLLRARVVERQSNG
jgi:nicotinamide-nucleotide amidase